MTGYVAYLTVYRFVHKEQKRREWENEQHAKTHALPNDHLADKIDEANEALTALEWLRQAASVTKPNSEPTYHQIALL